MKDTYFDQNRLIDETDRRFHATDLERVGGYVQVVPAVVERLAPLVTVGAWSFSERVLQDAEAIAEALGNHDEIRNLRRQRWWVRQWRRANGLYRVRVLDAAERALATRLLGEDGMPAECFPRAEGRLKDDNDARIIAQVIAVGGTLLLSSNLVMVRDQALQDWFDAHHNEWPGVQAHRLVRRVDPLFCRVVEGEGRDGRAHTNRAGGILARRRQRAARRGAQMLRETAFRQWREGTSRSSRHKC